MFKLTMPNLYKPMADPGFPWRGANSQSGCAFLFFLAENCTKMKEFGHPGGARIPGAP